MLKFKNKYFILRHGETTYQTKKRGFTYPWPDNPSVKLTKKGEKEIKKITKKIKEIGIDLIYSSDIFRTRQTAEIVAKKSGIKKIIFDKKLRDINLGIYHNKPKERSKTMEGFCLIFPDPKTRFSKRPKNGENWNDVKKRVRSFLKNVEKKNLNKTILIISHGDPLWLLEGIVKGLSNTQLLKQIFKKKYIKNGELRELKI